MYEYEQSDNCGGLMIILNSSAGTHLVRLWSVHVVSS